MITIEKFFKPENYRQYLRFTYDDIEDLLLLDSLLAEKLEIIEKDKNAIIAIFEKK